MKLRKILAALMSGVIMLAAAAVPVSADNDELIIVKTTMKLDQSKDRRMLDMINEFRASSSDAWYWNEADTEKVYVSGLKPLVYDYELEKAAMSRAADLVAYYAHQRPNGKDCFTAYPYDTWTDYMCGENIHIVRTQTNDYQNAFNDWLETDQPYSGQGHRRNLLKDYFTSVGIAHVEYEGWSYWVQDFGCSTAPHTTATAAVSTKEIPVEILASTFKSANGGLTYSSVTMKPGGSETLPEFSGTYSLTTKGYYFLKDIAGKVELSGWKSSDAGVASVSGNKVIAKAPGTANLTADFLGNTYTLTVTVKSSTPVISKGDLDGDGDIDANDVAMLTAHVKTVKVLIDEQLKRADLNGDGKVDSKDAVALTAHYKGIKLLK